MNLLNKEPLSTSSPINQEYRLKELKDILKYAINNEVSIHQALKHKGRGKNFFNENYIKFSNDEELLALKEQHSNNSFKITKQNVKTNVKKTVDLNDDVKYDKRSTWWANRDENGKIIDYEFKIMVRDEKDFCGTLSRSEMDSIYSQYPYTTQNNCSQLFPRFTFIEFKRLILCFQISKNKLLSLHSIEEESEEKLVELALKAKENSVYKKFITDKPIFIEKQLREVQKQLSDLQQDREWVENVVDKYFNENKLNPIRININPITNERMLIIYLSDLHIGACNKNAQFSKEYNEQVYYNRLEQILNEVYLQYKTLNRFDKICVLNAGDDLDGYQKSTTRISSNHILPQNLDDREQFRVYIESMIFFFEKLHEMNITNEIFYVSCGNDNHSGDLGYNANLSLKYIFKLKYPDMSFMLAEKFIEHFQYGEHNIIFCHGKDKELLKSNLPLTVDARTENFFVNYIKQHKLLKYFNTVVSGDLHQYATQITKNFRYTKVPSVYGGSSWTDLNFGKTEAGFVFQIFEKNRNNVLEGYLELD